MFSNEILAEFATHSQHLREAARRRREECTLKNAVEDPRDQEETDVRATFGVPQPGEVMAGDTAIRTLHQLLHIIDENGFERSPHQQRFRDAMIRAVARVLYRADWATKRPDIMARHGWTKAPSEVLISTPRRFGKTFRRDARPGVPRGSESLSPHPHPSVRSIAILVACLGLSCRCEAVRSKPPPTRVAAIRDKGRACAGHLQPCAARLAQDSRARARVCRCAGLPLPYHRVQPRGVARQVVRRRLLAHSLFPFGCRGAPL